MGTETSKGQRSPVCWTRFLWCPTLGLSIGLSSAVRGPRGRIGSPAGGYWLKLKKRQRSRDPHVAWLRSCHTPVDQSMDRIKVMCRRAIKTGRVEPRRSRARNSGSCQISRPSMRSCSRTAMLTARPSRIQVCSIRTPGRLGSRGVVSIKFRTNVGGACCSSANITVLATTS